MSFAKLIAVVLGTCVATLLAGLPAFGQEPAEASAIRTRLAQPAPLTPEEIGLAMEAIARTIRGRTVTVTDGVDSSVVDERGQAVLFAVLSGTLPVADAGLEAVDAPGRGHRWRGLRSPATPPRSEIAARQTIWVDVESLLPQRFEFRYDVPGMGDVTYDIRVE